MEPTAFSFLVSRVRAGEEEAVDEFIRCCEAAILREVQIYLKHARIRRVVDSRDVCQAVVMLVLARVVTGRFHVDHPQQLHRLLAVVTRHRVLKLIRSEQAACRDIRRQKCLKQSDLGGLADPRPDPSKVVEARDLVEAVLSRLGPSERYLAEQWLRGREWSDLAAETAEQPDALRKRLSRALRRVGGTLGLGAPSGN